LIDLGATAPFFLVILMTKLKKILFEQEDMVPKERGSMHVSKGDDERFWGNRGAGILLIAKDTGRLLLVLRSNEVNEPGTWGIPGGAIDDEDESEVSAAKREAHEEVGYRGPIEIHASYVFKAAKFRYFNFIGIVPKEFEPRLDWENDEAGWFSMDELPSPLHFGLKALLQNSAKQIASFTVSAQDLQEAFISDLDERELPSNESLWDKAKQLAMVKFGGVPTSKGYKWAKKWYHFKGGNWNEVKPKVREALIHEMNAISAGGASLVSSGQIAGSANAPIGSKARKKAKQKMWAEYKINK